MALEDRIQQALAQLAATLQQGFEERGRALATELGSAVEEERMAAEAQAMSTLAVQVASVRAEADARISEEVARARADVERALGPEVDRWREETTRARQQLESLAAELADARARAEQAEAAREAAVTEAREDTARAWDQLEQLSSELSESRTRAEGTERSLADLRTRLEQAQEAAEREETQLAAEAGERQAMLMTLDRLAAAARQIDAATTLSGVLTALAGGVETQTSRIAIFVLAGDGFQPYRSSGFGGAPIQPISRREATDLSRGLPSSPLPADHVGYSTGLVVGGQTVGVIYADDCSGGAQAVPAAWPEAIEILARHAAQRLEALTAVRAVQALGLQRPSPASGAPIATIGSASTLEEDQRARRYARLLVSEIKLYNEGAVRQGRQNRNLLEQLRSEIDRARHLYEQRVPAHVPSRSAYFDQELVQTLADGDPGLLGNPLHS
jgi:gas vesicle protein